MTPHPISTSAPHRLPGPAAATPTHVPTQVLAGIARVYLDQVDEQRAAHASEHAELQDREQGLLERAFGPDHDAPTVDDAPHDVDDMTTALRHAHLSGDTARRDALLEHCSRRPRTYARAVDRFTTDHDAALGILVTALAGVRARLAEGPVPVDIAVPRELAAHDEHELRALRDAALAAAEDVEDPQAGTPLPPGAGPLSA